MRSTPVVQQKRVKWNAKSPSDIGEVLSRGRSSETTSCFTRRPSAKRLRHRRHLNPRPSCQQKVIGGCLMLLALGGGDWAFSTVPVDELELVEVLGWADGGLAEEAEVVEHFRDEADLDTISAISAEVRRGMAHTLGFLPVDASTVINVVVACFCGQSDVSASDCICWPLIAVMTALAVMGEWPPLLLAVRVPVAEAWLWSRITAIEIDSAPKPPCFSCLGVSPVEDASAKISTLISKKLFVTCKRVANCQRLPQSVRSSRCLVVC